MQPPRRSPISFWLLSLFVIFAVMFPFSPPKRQVVGATISGTIRDASGAAIAGAQVTIRRPGNRCNSRSGQRRGRSLFRAFSCSWPLSGNSGESRI